MSGVSVRARPRLPAVAARRRRRRRRGLGPATHPILARPMEVTATPAPKSSVLLEIEVPADRLDRAVRDAVGRLSRRTRVAGFRPGKAPRPILERVLGPGRRPRRGRRAPGPGLVPRGDRRAGHRPADQRRRGGRRGRRGQAAPVQGDGPGPARRSSSATTPNFKFAPEIETVDDAKIDNVVEELRDQNATLAAVEDRGAKDGDWAVIGFAGTKDGVAVRRRHDRADAADHRRGPADPGVRGQPRRPQAGRVDRLRHHLPRRLPGGVAGRPAGALRGRPQGAAREGPARGRRRVRAVDGGLRGPARRSGPTSASGSGATPSTGPATSSATGSSSTPSPTRPSTSPTSWSTRRSRSCTTSSGRRSRARASRSPRTSRRPRRPRPTSTPSSGRAPSSGSRCCWCCPRSRRPRGSTSPTPRSRPRSSSPAQRYQGDAKTIAYFESERGRNFIRSTLRRTRTVETLVDRWLAAHPDHPAAAAPRGRRAVGGRGARGRGRRIHRRHRPGLDPGRVTAAAAGTAPARAAEA